MGTVHAATRPSTMRVAVPNARRPRVRTSPSWADEGVCLPGAAGTCVPMKPQRTMIRPMLAGLAVVGLSLGATACEDDDGDDDVDIDNPVDDEDVEDLEEDVDDGVDDLEEEIDEEIDDDTDG